MQPAPVKQEVGSLPAPIATNALNIDWNGLSDILKQVKPQQPTSPQQPALAGLQQPALEGSHQVYNDPPPVSQQQIGNPSHSGNPSLPTAPQHPAPAGPQQVNNVPPPGSQQPLGNPSHPVNPAQLPIGNLQGKQSANGNAEIQAIKAEPEPVEKEEEEDFYVDFTDEELVSLLKNFKTLEPLEQKDLIGYMKKLESEDPLRVTKLKEAMHTK